MPEAKSAGSLTGIVSFMSDVTNVVMSLWFEDARGPDSRIPEVNSFFPSPIKGLTSMDDPSLPRGWYGGSKMLEADLFVGALNHLDLKEFINHLRRIKWKRPDCVQLFIEQQEDERFRLMNLAEEVPPLLVAPHVES